MKPRILLDCGYYVGKALEYYAPLMDETWKVYAFEPNMDLDVENTIKRFPFAVEWIPKAVWVEDGWTDFTIGGRNDASFVSGLHPESTDIPEHVECIDFSKFVRELPEDATIVCSMDCEGAEFPVLEKMLEEGTAQRIALLDIEFHHNILGKHNSESSMLRRRLEGEGVLVKTKLDI